MLVKIRHDLYEIIRLPYANINKDKYVKIVAVIYFLIFFLYILSEIVSYIFLAHNELFNEKMSIIFIISKIVGSII
jgi:hypothetical protein